MKKIALLVLTVILALPLSAQLRVKAKTDLKQIGTIRMGVITVFQSSQAGFSMSLKTTNQYDDPGIFHLGKDKESAIATLDDMLGMLEEGPTGEALSVDTGFGTCLLKVDKQLGVTILNFSFDGCAGIQSMSKGELNKVKTMIEKAE